MAAIADQAVNIAFHHQLQVSFPQSNAASRPDHAFARVQLRYIKRLDSGVSLAMRSIQAKSPVILLHTKLFSEEPSNHFWARRIITGFCRQFIDRTYHRRRQADQDAVRITLWGGHVTFLMLIAILILIALSTCVILLGRKQELPLLPPP